MDPEEDCKKISMSAIRELIKNTVRVNKMLWKERKGTVLALLFFGLIISAMPFIRSGSQGLLINELIVFAGGGQISSYLAWIITVFVIAAITPSALFALQQYFMQLFRFFIEEKFDLELVKKKGHIDIAVHENPVYNDLFNNVKENGMWRVQTFGERQIYLIQLVIEVVVASVILIFAEWWIFLIILLGTIPELLVELRYGRNVWGIWSGRAEVRRRYWDVRWHFEGVPAITELKLFQNISHFHRIIKDLFRSFRKEQKLAERKRLINQLLSFVLSQTTIAFAIVWFIMQVIHGNLLIGTLTFFLISIAQFRDSLSSFFSYAGRQYQDGLFVSDIFKLLDIEPVIKKSRKAAVLNPQKTPTIAFENVSFAYPGIGTLVLKEFNLTIKPGEKIAFVGENGAGKTTLVKLLCRFYDPTGGRITVNGHDLKSVNLESWYQLLGVLFQDYAKYNFVVRDSIAVGRTGKAPVLAKVKQAAKASEADAFIEGWEESYNQMLGRQFTGGIEPSIGQWQKLALARTFYRDPRILILDEPTSSIDAQSEAKIFEKLGSMPKTRTAIYISHRFSTVRQANRIAVIEGGTITELGTHKQLLKKKKVYAKLFKLQAEKYQ